VLAENWMGRPGKSHFTMLERSICILRVFLLFHEPAISFVSLEVLLSMGVRSYSLEDEASVAFCVDLNISVWTLDIRSCLTIGQNLFYAWNYLSSRRCSCFFSFSNMLLSMTWR
jgi:hypothetical protein